MKPVSLAPFDAEDGSSGESKPKRFFRAGDGSRKGRRLPIIGCALLLFGLVIIVTAESHFAALRSSGGGESWIHASGGKARKVDWPEVKADILSVIKDDDVPGSAVGEKGPTLVRLAWHASGTYDKMLHDGGSGGGTIRFKEELAHGANAGLNKPVQWLEKVHKKHRGLSYADLYTYAGAVAIEAMGGPVINFSAGRVDALSPDAVTPDGRLPDADKGSPHATAEGLRNTFYRMGFNDTEIVVLSGAHALGRCHAKNSGYVGPWQETPTIFSNVYFKELKDVKWTPDERATKFQYKDPTGAIMMLPSDMVLIQDLHFKAVVNVYADDNARFYHDFAAAFKKLIELGCSGLSPIDTP